ncbi:DUF4112 domain-containing protein [Segetibacter sp.]|jgi:hypothetical protein|uniref:DUF4112 domain-containing protein n=1 Tax=Segetibacter sp. TaxID=2231182 RepID=UPI002614B0B9|nr:DUF4112 domain-containing protein [Segetibacter sp.]MCW3082619.1 hypothetical protein [Segetibacter sp.]
MSDKAPVNNPQLRQLDFLARLMDNQFKVPGTNFRFGLDAIIGLIPGAGDLSTFGISTFMLFVMVKNGASGFVLARMILNVLIDTIIGAIPLVGDLFDIGFKSNTRNMRLMREHYVEGRHKGGAWKVILPVLILFGALFAGVIWLIYTFVRYLYHQFG